MSNKLIDIIDITKSYDENVILDKLNLYIRENEFLTLLGPSGCGKTTLLRILGGFETPDSGNIIFDGKNINSLPPNRRQLNTVFQKYALFSHMSIAENIAFGLKIKGKSKGYIRDKIHYALKLVNLEGYGDRSPDSLSGGQQQRIAIARAIVNEPKVLLLDEPLGALDLKLRQDMQYELIRLKNELGITFVYVTHDQEEALTMSDTIVVMNQGYIQQIGTPQEVFDHPANLFVAGFIGTPQMNLFDAQLVKNGEKYAVVMDGVTVELSDEKQERLRAHNVQPQDITLGVRPDHLMLCADAIKGKVDVSELMGSSVHLHVTAGGRDVIVIVPTNGAATHFPMGSEVNLIFGGNVAHVFSKETGKNLEW